jgi:hypothetical protein
MADRIVALGTPEHDRWRAEYKEWSFKLATLTPAFWVQKAELHRRAANALHDIVIRARDREMARQEVVFATARATGDALPNSRPFESEELEDFYDGQLLTEYLLLSGYALECVTKGYLLAILPELLQDGKKLDEVIKTHDLKKLFHDCGLKTSEEESRLLDTISRQVVWGKYPTPLHVKDWPTLMDGTIVRISCSLERWVKISIDRMYNWVAELHRHIREARQIDPPPV